MMRFASIALLCCACGSVPNAFTGTVAGNGFEVKDAVLLAGQEIWLSSAENLCTKLSQQQYPKNGTIVKIVPHPVAERELSVAISTTADGTATMQFVKLDASCNNTLAFGVSAATKGTVKISKLTAGTSAVGEFDVTFGDNDPAKGTFNVVNCVAPLLYPNPTCVE